MDESHALRADVEALCSEACAGRAPGTPGSAAARGVIVHGFHAAGLHPELQHVAAGINIVARAGSGPARVLVGAHYDHLGRGPEGTFWGADDNAAAVALVLALGRALAREPPVGGTILLTAFDCEEPPHFLTGTMGSQGYVRAPLAPLSELRLVIILDLVGHAVGPEGIPRSVRNSLFVLGAETSRGTSELVDGAADDGVVIRKLGIDVIPPLSDYEPFRRAGVPFVFLSCGRWRHYHMPTDTPDRLDYRKLAAITRTTLRLARAALVAPATRLDDEEARGHAATLATTQGLARELAAASPRAAVAAGVLDAMRLGRDGRLSVSDYSTLLQMIGLLEQGLA